MKALLLLIIGAAIVWTWTRRWPRSGDHVSESWLKSNASSEPEFELPVRPAPKRAVAPGQSAPGALTREVRR